MNRENLDDKMESLMTLIKMALRAVNQGDTDATFALIINTEGTVIDDVAEKRGTPPMYVMAGTMPPPEIELAVALMVEARDNNRYEDTGASLRADVDIDDIEGIVNTIAAKEKTKQ